MCSAGFSTLPYVDFTLFALLDHSLIRIGPNSDRMEIIRIAHVSVPFFIARVPRENGLCVSKYLTYQ